MIGSLVGLILGILVTTSALNNEVLPDLQVITTFLAAFPAAIIFAYILVHSWVLIPLQKAEQNNTPRILDMFNKDPLLGFNHLGIIVLPFFSLVIGISANSIHFIPPAYLLGVWLFLMGASVDLLIQFLRRILNYLNPFMVTKLFRQAANRSIRNDKEADLCEWIDALAEVGSRALNKGGLSLCNESLNELREVTRLFLDASKIIGHESQDKQSIALGIKDKVTFTLFYLFQRLEMLFNKALEKRLEPVCSSVLTVFGKVAIDAAKCDITLSSFPLQYIGKLGFDAHQQKLQDIGLKTTCLYIEIAKALLTEIDITYAELQEPFFTIIHHMDDIAKETFKQNKEIPIKALTQPFRDLRTLFSEGKPAAHQDAPMIIADIDRVIVEFDALEMVLRTIPPISTLTGSSQQDVTLPDPTPPPPEPFSTGQPPPVPPPSGQI